MRQLRQRETPTRADAISREVIGAAIKVHKHLGPGLLESAYEAALTHELTLRSIQHQRQALLPVEHKGTRLDCCYRLDLLVEKSLIVELKSVDALTPLHRAQLLTYLRHANLQLGLLLNFNTARLAAGIKRVVND